MRTACPRRPRAVIIIPLSNAVVVGENKREIKVFVTQECDVNNGHRARPEVPDHSGFPFEAGSGPFHPVTKFRRGVVPLNRLLSGHMMSGCSIWTTSFSRSSLAKADHSLAD